MARIRGFPAGDGLDLDVHDGEVVRLVGPNGCGKTSILRALAGLPAPMAPRTVEVHAAPEMVFQSARDGLVGLTVAGEFRMRGMGAPQRPDGEQDTATLSQGEARRLALDVADGRRPRLLLLDEPTEGLDDGAMARLRACLEDRPGAIVVVDHDGRLDGLCDRRVHVGAAGPADLPPLPGGDQTVVEAQAGTVDRGTRAIATPAWHGTPGLHVVRGPNGCGKSSWLLALAGILPGAPARVRGREAVAGRDVRLLLPGIHDHLHEERVADALRGCDAAGLVPARLHGRHPLHLSGGEARRVALAKVLGRPAPLYLLDEPEAHLDADGRRALWEILRRRIQEGSCILAASHDPILQAAASSVVRWDSA